MTRRQAEQAVEALKAQGLSNKDIVDPVKSGGREAVLQLAQEV